MCFISTDPQISTLKTFLCPEPSFLSYMGQGYMVPKLGSLSMSSTTLGGLGEDSWGKSDLLF